MVIFQKKISRQQKKQKTLFPAALKISFLLLSTILFLSCYFLLEKNEEGRPCKEGRCPFGFVCTDDICIRENGKTNGNDEKCSSHDDCKCQGNDAPVCGVDERCRCINLTGSLDGVGATQEEAARFNVTGARFGHISCTTSRDPDFDTEYELCGGITQ